MVARHEVGHQRSAVNLTDWFLVRRGQYDVAGFFTPVGIYGRFQWRGLIAYAISLGVEFPFANQPPYYVGFMVSKLGGADISWIVGFFAAAGIYLALAARRVPARAGVQPTG